MIYLGIWAGYLPNACMGILRFLTMFFTKPLLKTRPWVFDKYKACVF
jgi:hypothetical protein